MAEADAHRDLASALAGLSGVLTDYRPLTESLIDIAGFAVQAIPGADGAGLTMLEDARAQTVVASAEFVQAVDDVQYGLNEGPCLLAVQTRHTQASGFLDGESRWPRFGPRAGRLGVHSVLSLPLLLPDRVVGALNVYAHATDAFGSEAVRIGELFARPAAVSVHNAQILATSHRIAAQLEAALTGRAVIDQAVRIVMSRTGDGLRRLRLSRLIETRSARSDPSPPIPEPYFEAVLAPARHLPTPAASSAPPVGLPRTAPDHRLRP